MRLVLRNGQYDDEKIQAPRPWITDEEEEDDFLMGRDRRRVRETLELLKRISKFNYFWMENVFIFFIFLFFFCN